MPFQSITTLGSAAVCKRLSRALQNRLGIPRQFLMVGPDPSVSEPGRRVFSVFYDRASHARTVELAQGVHAREIPSAPPDHQILEGFILGFLG